MAVALHLQACASVEHIGAPTVFPAAGKTAEWYDVISFQPGPEVTDNSVRQRVRKSGQPWKVRDKATGIEMVLVMPGSFWMGSPDSETGRQQHEGPQRRVQLTKALYLGATEVTQAQWRQCMGKGQGFFPGDDKPADGSWNDLQAFLSKANMATPSGAEKLRAPTEAEWEYACRAGTTGPFSFGGPAGHSVLNFNDGTVESALVVKGKLEVTWAVAPSPECRMTTVPAGSLPPNAWGLHEMHGNLWEWTDGAYSPEGYSSAGRVDPYNGAVEGELRALRGGSWYDNKDHCRSAARDAAGPAARSNRIGFRVARTL